MHSALARPSSASQSTGAPRRARAPRAHGAASPTRKLATPARSAGSSASYLATLACAESRLFINGRNLVGGFGTFSDNGQDLTEGNSEKGRLGNDSKRVNYDLAACYQLGLCSTVSAVRERKASTCAVSTYSFLSSIATLQMKCLSPRDDELSYSMV